LSSDAQKAAQNEINRIYELFVKTVSRNRSIEPQAVRDQQAGLFFGENAMTARMAASIMPYTNVMKDLQWKDWNERVRNTPVIR